AIKHAKVYLDNLDNICNAGAGKLSRLPGPSFFNIRCSKLTDSGVLLRPYQPELKDMYWLKWSAGMLSTLPNDIRRDAPLVIVSLDVLTNCYLRVVISRTVNRTESADKAHRVR
ncbi:hypothetical protein CEXT_381391, partial [Caerostris extrusa]